VRRKVFWEALWGLLILILILSVGNNTTVKAKTTTEHFIGMNKTILSLLYSPLESVTTSEAQTRGWDFSGAFLFWKDGVVASPPPPAPGDIPCTVDGYKITKSTPANVYQIDPDNPNPPELLLTTDQIYTNTLGQI